MCRDLKYTHNNNRKDIYLPLSCYRNDDIAVHVRQNIHIFAPFVLVNYNIHVHISIDSLIQSVSIDFSLPLP